MVKTRFRSPLGISMGRYWKWLVIIVAAILVAGIAIWKSYNCDISFGIPRTIREAGDKRERSVVNDTQTVVSGIDYSGLSRVQNFEPMTLIDALHKIRVDSATFENDRQAMISKYSYMLSSDDFVNKFGESYPVARNGFDEMEVLRRGFVVPQGEAHPDQLLASFAIGGFPLETRIQLDEHPATIADLVVGSRKMAVLEQELEWTIVAHCIYCPTVHSWKNRFGDEISLASMINTLLEGVRVNYACSATHVLYAYAVALRQDEVGGFLTPKQRGRLESVLFKSSRFLELNQYGCGAWGNDWLSERSEKRQTLRQMVFATGHHLEWISIAPRDLKPRPESLNLALDFFARELLLLDDTEIAVDFCGVSHGTAGILQLLSQNQPEKTVNIR